MLLYSLGRAGCSRCLRTIELSTWCPSTVQVSEPPKKCGSVGAWLLCLNGGQFTSSVVLVLGIPRGLP